MTQRVRLLFWMVRARLEVPARADVGIRPYGEGRRRTQTRRCQQRGVEDAAPYKVHASDIVL